MTRQKLGRLFSPAARFKIFFTLQYFGVGIFAPYMALYFQDKGLTGAQLGVILGLMPLVSIIAQPTWSTLSDYFQSRRSMLFLSCLSAAIIAIFYTLINSFLGLLIISILYALLYAPIGTLSTALALDYLEKENRQGEFGYIRLWGSLGFAFTALIAGAFFINTMTPILPLLYSAIMFAITLLVLSLPEGKKIKPTAWWQGIAVIFQKKEIIPYFIGCMFLNTSLSIGLQYLALFMDKLKSEGWMIGLAISLQALLEAPLMAKSPKWISKYGLPAVFLAGVILLPLRWLIFILIKDPFWIIPTSVFHSLTIVSLMVVGVKYVDSKFPREWRASGQGIYSTIMNGIGPSLGLLLAGNLYEIRDLQTVWTFTLGITLVGILILFAVFSPPKTRQPFSH